MMTEKIWREVRTAGRKNLTEFQASQLMNEYGIPMAKSKITGNITEALEAASELKYPVVLKIISPDILHKTDADCVKIGVSNEHELKEAYYNILNNAKTYKPEAAIDGVLVQEMVPQGIELILGVKKDPQFEHVIIFGLGGIYVEVFKDISLRLIPITEVDAEEMVNETRIGEIIKGARNTEYDLNTIISVLMNLSKLVTEIQDINQIDINPFFLYKKGKGGKGADALLTLS